MTTTFHTSGAHIATTRTGGRIVYQADSIEILDAIAAFIIFLLILAWGAIVSGSGDAPALMLQSQHRPVPRSWRGSGVGRVWVRQYVTAVIGG